MKFVRMALSVLLLLPLSLNAAGAGQMAISYEGKAAFEGAEATPVAVVLTQAGDLLEGEWRGEATGILRGWRRNGICSLKGRLSDGGYLVLLGECDSKAYIGNMTKTAPGGNKEGNFSLRLISGKLTSGIRRK